MIKHTIVLVPFPFDDLSATKVRPALCLTDEVTQHRHVVIAFISSRIPDQLEDSDMVIRKDSKEWEGTGLAVDSVIRLHRLITVPRDLLSRKLGRIDQATADDVLKKLHHLFGG